jgi:hypothetical protein
MCGLRTLLLAITSCLTGPLQASSAFAQSADLHLFATCAGRLSALMEDQWLIADPGSDQTALQRDALLSLVMAVATPDEEAKAISWRVEAKAAQAELLARARFGQNEKTAALAARQSDELIGMCRSLLLG